MCRHYTADIYLSRPPSSYASKLKQPPSVLSPLSARVDVRRCRRGFACAPIHHSTVGCVIYHGEKTSSIDNLLEELARVHANFWIIMPRRVHYASYRRPPFSNPFLPSPRLAPALNEMLQLSAPPAYPRQLHFAINLRYRTCDRIRRGSLGEGKGPANFESEVGERGLVTSRCPRSQFRKKISLVEAEDR